MSPYAGLVTMVAVFVVGQLLREGMGLLVAAAAGGLAGSLYRRETRGAEAGAGGDGALVRYTYDISSSVAPEKNRRHASDYSLSEADPGSDLRQSLD
jgi:hypothetical protein